MMPQIKVNLSVKKVDAVDGCIGLQTLIDDKPYSGEPEVIKAGEHTVIINGKLIDGVMQVELPEIGDVG